jgi:hypothetical protein
MALRRWLASAVILAGWTPPVAGPAVAYAQDTSSGRDETRAPITLVRAYRDSNAVGELERGTRQWFTGSYLPEAVVIRINGRRDRAACEETKEPLDFVQFSSTTPNAGRDPNGRTIAPFWSDSLGCVVSFRWLLGNDPGMQQLVVRLVHSGDNRPQPGYALVNPPLHVVAHEPPGLFIGVGLQDRTIRTGGESDTSALAAIVGVDLPSYLPISRNFWLRRIRLMVGTSILKPGADLHLGISWLPLLMGVQGERFSLQFFSGYRIGFGGRQDSWTILGLTYNASSAISSILRAFTP